MLLPVLWTFFHHGEKQNSSHFRAHCKGCVSYHLLQAALLADPDDAEDLNPTAKLIAEKFIFDQGKFHHLALSSYLNIIVIACQSAGSVRVEKSAMIAHTLGSKELCVNASAEATMAAKELKQLSTTATSTSSSITSHPSTSSTKHGQSASTESLLQLQPKKSKQTSIVSHTFKGINMPFSSSEIAAVQAQALCAVISANLSFMVFENPEVEKLFWML